MADNGATAPQGKAKDRSPNFPASTWTEALTDAKKIWDQEKRHPLSMELAAKHMGYKGLSGASFPAIAALKQYGLLIPVGKDVRISDEANQLFLYPAGSAEIVDIITKLVMTPPLFGKVLSKFPEGLPSDANLRARLQHEWKFASDKAADRFIKALREAVAIAGNRAVATEERNVDNGVEIIDEATMSSTQENAIKPNLPTIAPQVGMKPPVLIPGTQARPWDLGEGAVMMAIIPNTLTKKNIERLKKYVKALEVEAAITWPEEDQPKGGE